MNFKNLKITFKLGSEVILNRLTTIDSILLYHHYNQLRKMGVIPKDKFMEAKDDIGGLSKWLEVKDEVLSGSIWYMDKEKDLYLWNVPIRKSTAPMDIYKFTKKSITSASKPTPQSGEFKRYDLAFETMKIEEIYFYIRGDKEYIETLLKSVKYIGKKASNGYGRVSGYVIEEIEEDKSFMLDEFTASKPLPTNLFNVKSKKIAYHRTLPPYSDKKDKKACYMPTTSLVEMSDNSRKNKNFKASLNEDYIANSKFLKNRMDNNTVVDIVEHEAYTVVDNYSEAQGLFEKEKVDIHCACCGSKVERGIQGKIKQWFSGNYNDFPSMSKDKGLCENCMWSIQASGEKAIGFSLVNKDEVIYVQGSKMEVFSDKKAENTKLQSKFRRDLVENLDMQQVPFSLNFKTTTNTQHVGFKGEVSISNAMVCVNYGDSGVEYIDVELLNAALKDMNKIMEETRTSKQVGSGLKKTHFLNLEDYKGNPVISKDLNTLENRKILSEFHKKYNSSIRKLLHKVTF